MIATTAIKQKTWVLLFFLGMSAAGSYAVMNLPVDAVPDITNVQVMINTHTGALAPEEIETTVTFPIESELSGLPEIQEIRSISKYGLSQVTVVFHDKMDLYFARQLINEKLTSVQARLPAGIVPEMGPVSTGLGEIVMYTLKIKGKPDNEPYTDAELRRLRKIQDWTVAPRVKTVKGVAEVDTNGGLDKAVFIEFNPDTLARYGLSVQRILEDLGGIGENKGGGYIEKDGQRIIVRTLGRVSELKRIENITIHTNALTGSVPLKKLAIIREGNMPRVGATVVDGRESIIGTVLMRIGANSRTVASEVTEFLKNLELDDDIEIEILYARNFLVDSTVRTILQNLSEGAILVVVVLLVILGNLRAALIVALAIPISMLFSVTGMLELGISANLMSLGAVDFGLLVDGSVVMIENIIHKFEKRAEEKGSGYVFSRKEKGEIIAESAREVTGPVVSGLLIIMIVYVPILTLSGIEGKMFQPMAATVLMALAASLIVAIFLMPVLAYLFMNPPKVSEKKNIVFHFIHKVYEPLLSLSIKKTFWFIAPSFLFAVISVGLFFRLGSDFIPSLDEGDLVIGMVRRADISLDESVRLQEKADKITLSFPEVERVFSRMGTPESATDPMGINFADSFIILKKNKDEWPVIPELGRHRTKDELYEAVAEAVNREIPGQDLSPTQPIQMRFNEMLEGSRADVTLRIFGNDLKELMRLSEQAQAIAADIPGVIEVGQDELTALRVSPVLDLKVRQQALSAYGIHAEKINEAFETAMAGREVGFFYDQEIRYPIILRMEDRFRDSPALVGRIPVDSTGSSGTLPVSAFADVSLGEQVTTIARYNARRYAAVSMYLKDRDIESFVKEAREKMNAGLDLPEGFHLHWGGQFENLEKARAVLSLVVPLTLVVIFLILYKTFNDAVQSFLIMQSVPFAATGGIVFLWLRDISFSISAAVGFIALTGIAILNAMVLVSFYNQLRASGTSLENAVKEGTLSRLRPVLMTGLVASLGFFPMAFNSGAGAEVQRPLATVVIGGLVTATLLTLLLLPGMYYRLEKFRQKQKGSV